MQFIILGMKQCLKNVFIYKPFKARIYLNLLHHLSFRHIGIRIHIYIYNVKNLN